MWIWHPVLYGLGAGSSSQNVPFTYYYDPLGLLSPITVQLKLHMRNLFSKDAGLDWDTPLPPELKQEWLYLFQLLKLRS